MSGSIIQSVENWLAVAPIPAIITHEQFDLVKQNSKPIRPLLCAILRAIITYLDAWLVVVIASYLALVGV